MHAFWCVNVYLGPAGTIGEIFRDGFESGDIAAWQ